MDAQLELKGFSGRGEPQTTTGGRGRYLSRGCSKKTKEWPLTGLWAEPVSCSVGPIPGLGYDYVKGRWVPNDSR